MTVRKRFRCACGRRLTRQKYFYQTLSPFNRKPSGFIKDQGEILLEVRAEAAAWTHKVDPCTHVIRP